MTFTPLVGSYAPQNKMNIDTITLPTQSHDIHFFLTEWVSFEFYNVLLNLLEDFHLHAA